MRTKWINKYGKYVLRDFPFFYLSITETEMYGKTLYEGGHMFPFPRKQFKTLLGAQKHMEKLLYKDLKKSAGLIDLVTTLKDFEAIPHVYVVHSLWCNNNGDGRYHCTGDPERWKRYQWIEGRFSVTSATSKRYALRYSIDIPEADVKQHAIIIVKRSINRFIRNYERYNRV